MCCLNLLVVLTSRMYADTLFGLSIMGVSTMEKLPGDPLQLPNR